MKSMADRENYYIGLDMGTNSVGWAVTDINYKILRSKGKDMWGVRLFDEAKTAAERRTYRVARRRRQRETARIGLLKEYFDDAITAVDPGFFQRLEESKYYFEDRSEENKQPFALFNDENFTDKEYYAQYPTIFHLRQELATSNTPHDVRLVYLALLNLFKRRGHFLNKSLSDEGGERSMQEAYEILVDEAAEYDIMLPQTIDSRKLEECLSASRLSRKAIQGNLMTLLGVSKKQKQAVELVALLCGLKVTLIKIFGDGLIDEEHKKMSLSFREMDYEEKAEEIRLLVGDENFALISAAKEVHDLGLLAHILDGEKYLSVARVKQYEEHHRDLQQLKTVLKRYDRRAYYKMFREMQENNYSAYVGSVNYKENKQRRNGGKGKDTESFYKYVKKVLSSLPDPASSDPDVTDILSKIATESFMPKQLTADNGIIPNQVHVREMKAILDHAQAYLSFLNEKDASGLTVAERILQLYRFQIPYYVGPLGQEYLDVKGYNVWAKRRPGEEKGRILPWNFEQKIDVHQASQDFIVRMVRHCTYLKNEKTLPKQSLLYEKFMVLNEINNLKICGEKMSVALKQQIYEALFSKGKHVTRKQLVNYLFANGLIDTADSDLISGIDQDFKASLSSLGKFKGIFGDDVYRDSYRTMIEQIIFWGTVFGDDKSFLKRQLQEHYGDRLDERQIKRICGMTFSGWGNLSQAFLEMEGASKEDGVYRSVITALWETNDNLMEILSQRYTYMEKLEQEVSIAEKPLAEWTIEDLDDYYLSPAVKRMVWQTLKVVNEIIAVRGYAPSKVFVEMARDSATKRAANKNKRTQSRKAFLLNAYKEDKAWCQEIETHEEADFRIKKLYLYYMQHGRCMYSGATIDLGQLLSGNAAYDIDHIYPRHFVKDDSIENNLVLVKKEINAHKSDEYPLEASLRTAQYGFWKGLLDKGAITKEKFDRLTRTTSFSDSELANFINRQIVETRQGTKAVLQILKTAFLNEETEIISTKAGLTADFRHKFDLPKVRSINHFHHAHDAYLNIVVGNVYHMKFTNNPLNFIKNARKTGLYNYHMDRIFDYSVHRGEQWSWVAPKEEEQTPTIVCVKNQLDRRTVLLTRRSYMAHGGISNKATIYSKKIAKPDSYLPVKSSDPRLTDVTKYGGITSILNTAYALVEYTLKDKKVRSLEAIPLYIDAASKDDPKLLNYLEKILQQENKKKQIKDLSVRLYPVRQRSFIKLDGYYYYIGGSAGNMFYLLDAVPLFISFDDIVYMKKIEKAVERQNFDEKNIDNEWIISSEKNLKLYDVLTNKLTGGIYLNRKSSIINLLINGRKKFISLTKAQQCVIITRIISWFNSTQQKVDLTDIGGSANSGYLKTSKQISNAREAILIQQSVTGLYEKRIDLLTV